MPHVELDDLAHKEIKRKIDNVNVVEPFNNPIEAKSLISSMDIFVGARMHATIAAFSSGVACIPMSYSRKFTGLYNSLGYDYVVDLERANDKEVVALVDSYIKNYRELTKAVNDCYDNWNIKVEKIKKTFESVLINCVNEE